MNRRGVLAAAGVGLAAGAGFGVWRALQGGADDGSALLWSLRLPRPRDGELVMADFRGRPLVVNFWATWCAPCVREMPQLDRFARDFAAQGWQVVGLAIDNAAPVRDFLVRVPVTFPIGLAGAQGTALSRALGNANGLLPYTVALDAAGRVTQRKLGESSYEDLRAWT